MIISNDIIYGSAYATGYTGQYFSHCDTYNEVRNALRHIGISISKPKRLSEITPEDIAAKDKFFILVQFSKEENYTEYDFCWMTIQKKYLKRFIKQLREDDVEFSDEVLI